MESPIHAYCDLFRQLGLPGDPAATRLRLVPPGGASADDGPVRRSATPGGAA